MCVQTRIKFSVAPGIRVLQLYKFTKFYRVFTKMRPWCNGQFAGLLRPRRKLETGRFFLILLEQIISSVLTIYFPLVTFCFWKLLAVNLLSFYPVQSAVHLTSWTSTNRGRRPTQIRRSTGPCQIVWCYTNYRYKPYLSHRKVRLLTFC